MSQTSNGIASISSLKMGFSALKLNAIETKYRNDLVCKEKKKAFSALKLNKACHDLVCKEKAFLALKSNAEDTKYSNVVICEKMEKQSKKPFCKEIPTRFTKGGAVIVTGLQNKPQCNGLFGTISGDPNQNGRFPITYLGKNVGFIKPENLRPVNQETIGTLSERSPLLGVHDGSLCLVLGQVNSQLVIYQNKQDGQLGHSIVPFDKVEIQREVTPYNPLPISMHQDFIPVLIGSHNQDFFLFEKEGFSVTKTFCIDPTLSHIHGGDFFSYHSTDHKLGVLDETNLVRRIRCHIVNNMKYSTVSISSINYGGFSILLEKDKNFASYKANGTRDLKVDENGTRNLELLEKSLSKLSILENSLTSIHRNSDSIFSPGSFVDETQDEAAIDIKSEDIGSLPSDAYLSTVKKRIQEEDREKKELEEKLTNILDLLPNVGVNRELCEFYKTDVAKNKSKIIELTRAILQL